VRFEKQSPNKDFNFYNTIFIGSGDIVSGPSSGERFAGNVWWNADGQITFREYKDLATWADASGQEKLNGQMTGMQTNPLLNGPYITNLTDPYKMNTLNGYMLKSESPLKNIGLNLQKLSKASIPEKDFFGNPLPSGIAPEPGIFEIKE